MSIEKSSNNDIIKLQIKENKTQNERLKKVIIMINVTREFNNVAEGYRVEYDDSADEYNVINVKDEFCELNTQDEKEVQKFFNEI